VEVIEDFMLHAPLKNIKAEVKYSQNKKQGFSKKVLNDQNMKADIIRTHEKSLEQVNA
jgi:hypothetical protein